MEFSAALDLETAFVLDGARRIVSTREPYSTPGPAFVLIRTPAGCAWAVRADIPAGTAAQLLQLAGQEPPVLDFEADPVHAARYLALLPGERQAGPVFTFPDDLPEAAGVEPVEDIAPLERGFRGWIKDELPERSPMLAVLRDGHAVSVCFCARRSDTAAEAGVETAEASRGQGLAPLVTIAWARAVRASGRLPIYSTAWTNLASRAVARKLGLIPRACHWSIG